ncbi:sugar phosphate isomerase/epimerase [Vallitalea guaymasensis]|uniref:sugar phosphate isomerase/epimerase n=1 Tax=Vallitalea guaymasensis TaxID=1185412 RepID=UPI0023522371|nr:sugar phosphate isomerase/epimerase [Vallitalea guaymasensis]
MERFLIGHFGIFDENKQERDFREGFYGVEACTIDKEEDIDRLIKASHEDNFNVCVHFPLRSGKWKFRDPQFMSDDMNNKKDSYEYMEEEITYICEKFDPHYILFHYPKPVILDPHVDWSNWRFADESEYVYDSEYTYDEFVCQTQELFKYLSTKAKELDFIPVLEFDALNKYVVENNILTELLDRYPSIRLCLDIARLHLQDIMDNNFDPYPIIEKYAKYAEVIHLSNGRLCDNRNNNHYPALPELKTSDGWADISKYFRLINEYNKDYKVLFEHRSDKISDEQLESCYRWVEQLTNQY